MSNDFAADYIDVATRIAAIRGEADRQYPDGSFQPLSHDEPYRLVQVGDVTFLAYVAAFYRTPDDPRPGVGAAWEQVPGRTTFTRGSELQNAETSAWGRALVAALAADTKRGINSAEEVRNRQAEQSFGDDPLHAMRNKLLAVATERGWDMDRLSKEFYAWSAGNEIREADLETLTRYHKTLAPPKTAQRKPLAAVEPEASAG